MSMQVNFNSNINSVRPNFTASFSDDVKTRMILNNLNKSNYEQINLLATHYALQDIASNDKISLVENCSEDAIYAKNLTNGKEIKLNEYHPAYYSDELPARLKIAIENRELIDAKPKFNMETYVKKATDFLTETSKKENCRITKLNQQIINLEKKLKSLKDKLWSVSHNERLDRANAVRKEIFSIAKKVK